MASGDAWQAGIDIASRRRNQDNADGTGGGVATTKAPRSKPAGGILGAAGRGFGKLFGPKNQTASQAAGGAAPAAQLTAGMQPMQYQQFKRGGWVRRTGLALVHKGEFVIPTKGRSGGRKGLRKRMIVKP